MYNLNKCADCGGSDFDLGAEGEGDFFECQECGFIIEFSEIDFGA